MASSHIFLFLFLFAITNATPLNSEDRIIKGHESVKNSHPFMVTIQEIEYLLHFCGGSLINSRTVLTAAHCVLYPKINSTFRADQVMVILGEHHMYRPEGTELKRYVAEIIINEVYKSRTELSPFDSDIALLILNEDVPFTDAIQPICLYSGTDYHRYKIPTVAGWGQTLEGKITSTNLLEIQIPIIDNENCAKAFRKNWNGERMICAGYPELPHNHEDICQGDSGGPLFIEVRGKKVQIGLVSFNSALGCSRKRYPASFTKISEFIDWIVSNAKGDVYEDRIISGKESDRHAHPFLVSIQDTEDFFHFCGGALINSRTILTAAHCIFDLRTKIQTKAYEISVSFGEHNIHKKEGNEVTRRVRKVIKHEIFPKGQRRMDSDIALLILDKPVTFSATIQPICISSNKHLKNVMATVAGWGETRKQFTSSLLMEIDIPIIDNQKCAKVFEFSWYEKHMLCAGYPELPEDHPDVCDGDSGGPVFMTSGDKKVQIGIVSFGSGKGCAQEGHPSVLTKLSEFIPWVLANAEGGDVCVVSVQDVEYPPIHFCGGSLINSRTILTAAHCIYSMKKLVAKLLMSSKDIRVVLGDHNVDKKEGNEVIIQVRSVIKHETFPNGVKKFDSDIALLILDQPVTFNDYIQPICINSNKNLGNVMTTVAGWGRTLEKFSSSILMETNLPIIDNDKCSYSLRYTWYEKHMLCIGYPDLPDDFPDTCQGDSGGPVFIKSGNRNVQVGIVSFGTLKGCSIHGYPGGLTKVSEFVPWILENAEGGRVCVV
uniref:limulus clotting factor C n=1 Tax=Strigamia maritima TaxID=126957 RepID=T1IT27_STRMM